MKNKGVPVFLLMFIAVFLSDCMGQGKSPDIYFASDTYNFGVIEEGKSVNHIYEFTNTGTATLIVEEIRPTCGCTVAGDYDREVKPGQSGKIPIVLNTSGFDGYLAKSVIVKTNVPGDTGTILTIEGNVKVSVDVKPKVLSFGDIERNRTEPLEGSITIVNRLPDPFAITDIIKVTNEVMIPNVTVSNENVETQIKTLKDGFVYSLTITVQPPFKHGQVMGIIRVKTDSTIVPELNTQFSYSMEPLVKVFPNPLFVTKDHIKKGEEQMINIVYEPDPGINSGDAQLSNDKVDMGIVDLSVNSEKVKVNLKEVEKGKRYTIVLRFPGNFTFDPAHTLTVKFKAKNVPDEPVFAIPVLGM